MMAAKRKASWQTGSTELLHNNREDQEGRRSLLADCTNDGRAVGTIAIAPKTAGACHV